MRALRIESRHIDERRLAALALTEIGDAARSTGTAYVPAEAAHLHECDRCARLLAGHRRAARMLLGPWGRVEIAQSRRRPPISSASLHLGQVAAAVAVTALVAGGLLWWRQAQTGPSASTSPSSAFESAPASSAAPTPTMPTASPSASPAASLIGPYPPLTISGATKRSVQLPAGAQPYGIDQIQVDGDWLVSNFRFDDQPNGHQDQLYAVNVATGASRPLADHHAEASLAGSLLAWVDPVCMYPSQPAVGSDNTVCTAWRLHLTDLDTGADRVVASGSVPGRISTPVYEYGNGEEMLPRAALSATTLAYSTGDLETGFVLHLLSLATGTEREVKLAGMVDEMRWAGDDLAWIEDTDLRSDGIAQGYVQAQYYAGTRLMLLAAAAESARAVGSDPYWLEGEPGLLVWSDPGPNGSGEVLRAFAPDWQGTVVPVASSASVMEVASGWIGWFDYQLPVDTTVVLRPGHSEPEAIAGCLAISGDSLILVDRDPITLEVVAMQLVRIADLP
jgi:hypothetical protein